MKIKVFTLRYDSDAGGFDDSVLDLFFAEHDALQVSEHFFIHENTPTLGLVVTYRSSVRLKKGLPKVQTGEHRDRIRELRDELTPREQSVYDALRKWRNDKAKAEGKPPYLFLTNRQIYEISRLVPSNLNELRSVEGIGDAKISQFGAELVLTLSSFTAGTSPCRSPCVKGQAYNNGDGCFSVRFGTGALSA